MKKKINVMKIYNDVLLELQIRKIMKEWEIKAERIAEMKRTCVPCWKGGEV
jgi:hypothetical protein